MSEVSATDRTLSPARPGGLAPHASAPVSAPTAPQPVSQAPAPAVQLAASLLRLIENTTIDAVVVGRMPQGWPVVRSDAGHFVLADNLQLAINTRIVLELLRGQAQLQAVLLRVDGEPVPTPPTVSLQPLGPGGSQPPYPMPAPGTAPSVPHAAPPPQPVPLPHAAPPQAIYPAPPPAGPQVAPTAPPAIAPGALLTAVTVAGPPESFVPVHVAPPTLPLPIGTQIVVSVRAVVPPVADVGGTQAPGVLAKAATATPVTPTPIVPGAMITAVVTARTVAGHPYLHSTVGPMVLPALERVPVATELQLQVESLRLPPPPAQPVAPETEAPLDAVLRLGRDWASLRETVAVLQGHDPAIVEKIRDSALPQPNRRLAGAALLFLTALRGGDVARWLGETALQALDRIGRADLTQRLGDDFRQLAALADERPGSDWRMLLLPIVAGAEVRQALLFVRRRGGDRDREGRRKGPTRFLLNLELAATGSLQLDGFLRDRRFDLVLRSRHELPGPWKHDIRGIWEEALAITGMTGNLNFHADGDWPLFPIDEFRRAEAAPAVRV